MENFKKYIRIQNEDTLLSENKKNIEIGNEYMDALETSKEPGVTYTTEYAKNKARLGIYLRAIIEVLESIQNTGDLTDDALTGDEQWEKDQQKAKEKDNTISGTVVMGDNKPEYDGTMENPIDNPEAYKPTETSEDAQRLKEIGQIIISVLKIVGVAVAVIMLIALGLKYMAGGASEKAEYKKTMIPFLIGAFVLIVGPQLVGIIYNLVGNIE